MAGPTSNSLSLMRSRAGLLKLGALCLCSLDTPLLPYKISFVSGHEITPRVKKQIPINWT